jgi:hypothetical protein
MKDGFVEQPPVKEVVSIKICNMQQGALCKWKCVQGCKIQKFGLFSRCYSKCNSILCDWMKQNWPIN